MQDLPPAIFQQWKHSFEQDAAGVRSYRSADAALPRARGRAGLELRPDGTLVDVRIGRDDRPHRVTGRWYHIGENRLLLTFDDGSPGAEAEIVGGGDEWSLELRLKSPGP